MFGLAFLYPAFLIGALAAAVPVLLHLLKREVAPPVRFPAVRFLTRSPVEQTRRKRLRELLLLALRVAALVLLAGAFARPYLADRLAASGGVTVVAVDTSFSLSSPGRFDRVRALAREAVDEAPAGDLVAIVSFSDDAAAVSDPSADRTAARRAIDALAPGFGATRYRAALDRAQEIIGGRRGRIVLVTDLQRTGWRAEAEGIVGEDVDVVARDVGGLPSNLGVADLVREAGRATAVIRNGGAGARQGHVRLYLNGREAARADFDAAPGSSVDVTFDVELPAAGVLRVALDDPTGFAADDARYLVLDPPAPPAVLVVAARAGQGDEAFYVQRALDATGDARRFRVVTTDGAGLLSALDEGRLGGYAAILLLATRGVDRRAGAALARYVQDGGGLLLAAGEALDAEIVVGLFSGSLSLRLDGRRTPSAVTLAPVDARHPVFRPFGALAGNLGQVRFSRVVAVTEEGWQVIARFSDGTAALVERRVGAGRAIVFASDLNYEWNDFPLHPAFVPFVHELVGYLAGRRREPSAYLVSDAPAGAAREPGVATVGDPPRTVAVNVDPRESDPTRLTPEEFEGAIRRLTRAAARRADAAVHQTESEQSYWRYGLMLMLIALAAEGLVGKRFP